MAAVLVEGSAHPADPLAAEATDHPHFLHLLDACLLVPRQKAGTQGLQAPPGKRAAQQLTPLLPLLSTWYAA